LSTARGNEESDLLAVDALRDVDADDPPVGVGDRAAAHAGIDRAREVDALVVALVDEAVVRPLDDGEAEVEGIAHRVDPLAFREFPFERARVEIEVGNGALGDPHDGEVVRDVDREEAERSLRAVGREVFEAIGPGIEREPRDHVVVRDRIAVGAHDEPRADRGLPACRLQQRADLEDAGLRHLEDALGGRGESAWRGLGRCARRSLGHDGRAGGAGNECHGGEERATHRW
jgi:hypothetical protein